MDSMRLIRVVGIATAKVLWWERPWCLSNSIEVHKAKKDTAEKQYLGYEN